MSRYILFTCTLMAAVASPVAAGQKPDDSVKLEMRDDRPVVDGLYINGHGPFRFLLDTGATLNHVDPALAQSMGLTVNFQTKVVSSTGMTLAAGSKGNEVRLGSAVAGEQTFLFSGIDAVHDISPDLQGVLGQAFLSRFDYLLDLKARRLEFGQAALDGKGARAPFRTVQGRPLVTTSLGSLVLDSGANSVVRFRVQARGTAGQLVTASGTRNVGTVFSQIAIDGRRVWQGDAIAIPDSPETSADGLLPVLLFKSVYVSNSGQYVVFQ